MVTPHTNLVILHICCKLMNSLFSNIQSVHSMDYNLIAYDAFTGLATNYVSVNWVTNGAGNDLWPIRCQALTWPNADLLSIGCLETNAGQFWIKNTRHLTHLSLVTHICVNELGRHRFRYWLVDCSAPSRYLNQCWRIVNWSHGNKFQWNMNRNSVIFIQENAFENVFCLIGGHSVQGEMS